MAARNGNSKSTPLLSACRLVCLVAFGPINGTVLSVELTREIAAVLRKYIDCLVQPGASAWKSAPNCLASYTVKGKRPEARSSCARLSVAHMVVRREGCSFVSGFVKEKVTTSTTGDRVALDSHAIRGIGPYPKDSSTDRQYEVRTKPDHPACSSLTLAEYKRSCIKILAWICPRYNFNQGYATGPTSRTLHRRCWCLKTIS